MSPVAPATDLLRVRVLLAEGRNAEARAALARVPATGGVRERLERGLLTARALADHDREGAHSVLQTALASAQQAGFLMTLVEEGPQLLALLESLPAHTDTADYVLQLLHASRHLVPGAHAGDSQALIDPLSTREITVLRHLASQLDSTQIAAAMYLSVNTVRTHIKAIYRKLGVNSRHAAVGRGRDLDLY